MPADLVRRDTLVTTPSPTLSVGSLASLVQRKKSARSTFLLLDCSGSMAEPAGDGGRFAGGTSKIAALRGIVQGLKADGVVAPMVGFGLDDYKNGGVGFVESVPKAFGATPLAYAIDFASAHDAGHLVIISDGLPDSPQDALDAARRFAGPIDVFYVGPRPSPGETFLQNLARVSGGQCQSLTLSQPKAITDGLRKLLAA